MIRIRLHFTNRCICLLLLIMLGLHSDSTGVSAAVNTTYELGSGDNRYKYDDLLYNYQTTGISYERNTLAYQIEVLNSTLAAENYSSSNIQYNEATTKLSQLKELRESYIEYKATTEDPKLIAEIDAQIATIDAQINQYDSSVYSIKASMSEAKLQEEIKYFYNNYHVFLLQEAQNKLKNDFLKKCYNLLLVKEQQEYYETYQEYLGIVKKVEEIKWQRGNTDFTSLDLAKSNLMKNELAIEKNSASYSSAYSSIKLDTNMKDNSKIILPLVINQKEYNLELTINKFVNNNTGLLQLQNLKQSYQTYQNSYYGSYTINKQVSLKIKDYQLQYDELKANVKAYVTDTIFSYTNAFASLAAADQELQLATKKYNIASVKKEHKKATDLEVSKAKYEIEAAQVLYYQCVYNIIVWQDILDNCVYGVTP